MRVANIPPPAFSEAQSTYICSHISRPPSIGPIFISFYETYFSSRREAWKEMWPNLYSASCVTARRRACCTSDVRGRDSDTNSNLCAWKFCTDSGGFEHSTQVSNLEFILSYACRHSFWPVSYCTKTQPSTTVQHKDFLIYLCVVNSYRFCWRQKFNKNCKGSPCQGLFFSVQPDY